MIETTVVRRLVDTDKIVTSYELMLIVLLLSLSLSMAGINIVTLVGVVISIAWLVPLVRVIEKKSYLL